MAEASNLSQVVFKLYGGNLAEEIHLKPEAWRLLTQVDGVRTVAEIAHRLAMDPAAAASLAESLYRAGVLEVTVGSVAPPRATVNGAFFDHVTHELTQVMGPLASLIIEDEVSALGEKREDFPRDRVAELVERVSEAIHDDARRWRFEQIMLETLRKLQAPDVGAMDTKSEE